jgi:hypothetical protein
MTSTHALLAPHVQAFVTGHLCHQTRVSPHTIARCRDTCRLRLTCGHETGGMAPSALCGPHRDAPTLLACLDDVAHHRGHTVRSRHLRLSALRTCVRFGA